MNNSEALMEPFPSLVLTTVQYAAFGDRRSFIIPSRIYGHGVERVATVEQALELLFRQLNHVDGTELISQPEFMEAYPRLRSMCVDDIVTFRGPCGWQRTFVCEGMGWKEVAQ